MKVEDAMKHSGVESHEVVSCMSDSGGLDKDAENDLLETQLDVKKASGVLIVPSVSVKKEQ